MSRVKLRRVYATGGRPVDNTAPGAKAGIRRYVLSLLAAEGILLPPVLDCFCGQGIMWRQAYHRTPAYLRLDERRMDDARSTILCDNRRFLRHASTDLDRYALFDIDAYGFPHEQLALICARLTWRCYPVVGIVLTDAANVASEKNAVQNGTLKYLGISRHRGGHVWGGMRRELLDLVIQKTCQDAHASAEQVRYLEAEGKRGTSAPLYIGYLMRHQPSQV